MNSFLKVSCLVCLVAGVFSGINDVQSSGSPGKKVVCYFSSWAVYRHGAGQYDVEDIDPFVCTHVIFSFAGINEDGSLKVLDPYNELEENWGRGSMKRFNNLKNINPELKTLLAVGGWNEGSQKYSRMAEDPASRKRFIETTLAFLKKMNFDGLDIDWEYPGSRGGRPQDFTNFAILCAEAKAAMSKEGLLVTAAVPAGESKLSIGYDIPSISRSLDFINLMSYDLHGTWNKFTGHNAPMYPMPTEVGNDRKLNVDHAINYFLNNGCPPEKLIMGLPAYGRSFILDNPAVNGPYAPASYAMSGGKYTNQNGMLGYNEIVELLANDPNGWTIIHQEQMIAPYAFSGNKWIGYDDVMSIAYKTRYAMEKGLGGTMFWSIETDDFHGAFSDEKYPLIKTSMRTLNGGSMPKPPSTTSPAPGKTTKNSITTTSTAAPPPSSDQCSSAGSFRSSTDCSKFYVCVASGKSWTVYQQSCSPGLIFNEVSGSCDWPQNVEDASSCQ